MNLLFSEGAIQWTWNFHTTHDVKCYLVIITNLFYNQHLYVETINLYLGKFGWYS